MAGHLMQLEDWLDDLCVRFIINLPEEDLSSVARICFQVEEAQWFYEDFIRPLDPSLPSMSLRTFCLRIFQHCPLLAQFSVENHTKAFEEFLEYKTRIPVRGAIMINHAMDSAVLVKGWKKGANWGFPGGKINKDEDDLDCAIREVYEETGFDVRAAGLVPADGKVKYIELPIRNHQVRLYVFRDVPMDTNFQPRTRKEISKIQWYRLSELPTFRKKTGQTNDESVAASNANKFYMVAPFMIPLKKWVGSQKKIERKLAEANPYLYPHMPIDEVPTEEEGWTQAETEVPARPLPIDTLDGASQELQRLLKMQPPTQGLQHQPQRQPQHDKGSALLSMLQAKSSGPSAGSHEASRIPQTPLEQTFGNIAQPRNPHHHTNQQVGHMGANQQQPPPVFPIAPGQTAYSGAFHQQISVSHQSSSQGPSEHMHQHSGNYQANLVHPQPLPPQVQRAIFDKSAFQEGQQTPQSQIQGNNENYQWAGQGVQAQNRQQPPPPPPQVAQPQARQVQLNGQSLALLNAFKRDDVAPAPQPLPNIPAAVRPTVEVEYHRPADVPSYDGHGPTGQRPFEPVSKQKSPTELAGSGVNPAGEQHRSALLGMFKRGSDVDAGAASRAAAAAPVGNGAQPGHSLLQQLQGQSQGNESQLSPHKQASLPVDPNAQLGFDRLAIHQHPSQPVKHAVNSSTDPYAQPMSILQRNQQAQPLPQNVQPAAKNVSYAPTDQPAAHYPTAPHAGTIPAKGVSNNQGQGAPNEQKRQLLSLFGKQQPSPTNVLTALQTSRNEPMARELSASRNPSLSSGVINPAQAGAASSPRRAEETPMSPAEQSFLLDYLQSVTNTSSR